MKGQALPTSGEERLALQRKLLTGFRNEFEGSEISPLEKAAIECFCKWLLERYTVLPLDKNQTTRLDDTRS